MARKDVLFPIYISAEPRIRRRSPYIETKFPISVAVSMGRRNTKLEVYLQQS